MPYVKSTRRPGMIGCSIRKGTTPGGFAPGFGSGRRQSSAREQVHAAATALLEKRGVLSPDFMTDCCVPRKEPEAPPIAP